MPKPTPRAILSVATILHNRGDYETLSEAVDYVTEYVNNYIVDDTDPFTIEEDLTSEFGLEPDLVEPLVTHIISGS
jgi:hypothetical protein